jgi:hypothetical protein
MDEIAVAIRAPSTIDDQLTRHAGSVVRGSVTVSIVVIGALTANRRTRGSP